MKKIKGDLVLKENTVIKEDVVVEGNVRCVGGRWDLTCGDLKCWKLDCENLSFFSVAIAYKSFKCKSWKARRGNYVIKCLDGEIEIKDDKKYCDKCGQEIK